MTRNQCGEFLNSAYIGHIACTEGEQSYVTPFSFAYEEPFLYCFGTVGKRILWMRANPLVCVEVDSIVSREEWRTVVIQGRYEELPNTPQHYKEIDTAHDLLAKSAVWWEPGYSKTIRAGGERTIDFVWFKVSIVEISGHQAIPDRPIIDNASPFSAARQIIRKCLLAWATALR
jgi:nitroimidazol reductase NimA-like FMN-containing flavoprotein (pyridoxamine 5'-phosphate oxidase superfamily)